MSDDLKHQMDFILKQQAIFSSDMVEMKNRLDQANVRAQQQGENIDKLAVIVQQLADAAEVNRQEMRQAIENLIVGNEATRDLANRAAQLAINVSQHIALHEQEMHNRKW
ncbi:MAG: hypothetical protein ACREDR_38245 [Blastocatellia bacterium]